MKTVGLIGCGAIGTLICEAVDKRIVECDGVILYDLDATRAEGLGKTLHVPMKIAKDVDEMIKLEPTVIIEAASQQAVEEYIPQIVSSDLDVIVMSVGALLDLKTRSPRLHYPSGAIGGLDALSSADLAGIDDVVLTSRKNPRALDMNNCEEKLVYEGNAEETVRRFPREMNVAATLALTVGSGKVHVRVVSDPSVKRNVHEVKVRWKHGDMLLRFENDPHPENPRTSALAAWSAIRLLKDMLEQR